MKRCAMAAALLAAAVLMLTGCAKNQAEEEKNESAAEQTANGAETAQATEEDASVLDFYGVTISDGTDYPELLECIKSQLMAAKVGDYDAFRAAMRPELLIEMVLEQSEDSGAERLSDEETEAMIKEQYEILKVSAAKFSGELEDVVLQTDKEPKGSIRVFVVEFNAGGEKYYATGYSRDGQFGAAIENETSFSGPLEQQAHEAAQANARIIGTAAERAVEQYGAIPDGSYTFDVNELVIIDEPKDALEAVKSAVAKAFQFAASVDEGTMFLLIENGDIYAQWKSGDDDPEIGEYPPLENDIEPEWQKPVTADNR